MLSYDWCPNKYDLGFSNELLFVIIAQGPAKLRAVKVGSLKGILLRGPLHRGSCSSPRFFSDLQLCQVTLLQPFEL